MMTEYELLIIRSRLEDLPLVDDQGKPKELPPDCIEYLLSIFEWLASRRPPVFEDEL